MDIIAVLKGDPLADVKAAVQSLPEDIKRSTAAQQVQVLRSASVGDKDEIRSIEAAGAYLMVAFQDMALSAEVFHEADVSALLRHISALDFSESTRVVLLKLLNNAILPHESLLDHFMGQSGLTVVSSLLAKAPCAPVQLMVFTFLHRLFAMFPSTRLPMIESSVFPTYLTGISSTLVHVGSDSTMMSADTVKASEEAMKGMYALLCDTEARDVIALQEFVSGLCSWLTASQPTAVPPTDSTRQVQSQAVAILMLADIPESIAVDARFIEALLYMALLRMDLAAKDGGKDLHLTVLLQLIYRLVDMHKDSRALVRLAIWGADGTGALPAPLQAVLQSFDLDCKLMAEEILWKVLDEDAASVVERLGIGLAAGLLQRKGSIHVPE